MKYDKHGNGNGYDDLYILPETNEEMSRLLAFLKSNSLNYYGCVSNVEGSDWHGKNFIEVPFCESWKEAIIKNCE
jgi:hypothetical protein